MSIRAATATHRRTYVGLQYLRAIAALLVVYSHAVFDIPRWYANFEAVLTYKVGQIGVDIFFVLSGFVMWMTGRRTSPAEFFLRRVVRIVPLYWLATLVAAATAVAIPYDLLFIHHFTVVHLLESLTFIPFQNVDVGTAQPQPLLSPGWTLDLEMMFYALFALTLYLPSRVRLQVAGTVLVSLSVAGLLLPAGPPVVAFYMTMRMLDFWLGMLIAELSLTSWTSRIPAPLGAALAASGFVALWALYSQSIVHPFPCAIAASAVVLGAVSVEERIGVLRIAPLEAMGDASYSIYLTHLFALGVVRTVWGKLYKTGLPAGGAYEGAFLLACFVCTVVLGLAIYRFVERPLLKVCRAALERRRTVPAPVPAP